MSDETPQPGLNDAEKHPKTGSQTSTETVGSAGPMSKSMHDGVQVWCDCCSCEAEPYWIEAMQGCPHDGGKDTDR